MICFFFFKKAVLNHCRRTARGFLIRTYRASVWSEHVLLECPVGANLWMKVCLSPCACPVIALWPVQVILYPACCPTSAGICLLISGRFWASSQWLINAPTPGQDKHHAAVLYCLHRPYRKVVFFILLLHQRQIMSAKCSRWIVPRQQGRFMCGITAIVFELLCSSRGLASSQSVFAAEFGLQQRTVWHTAEMHDVTTW